jgi:hypothetical protein
MRRFWCIAVLLLLPCISVAQDASVSPDTPSSTAPVSPPPLTDAQKAQIVDAGKAVDLANSSIRNAEAVRLQAESFTSQIQGFTQGSADATGAPHALDALQPLLQQMARETVLKRLDQALTNLTDKNTAVAQAKTTLASTEASATDLKNASASCDAMAKKIDDEKGLVTTAQTNLKAALKGIFDYMNLVLNDIDNTDLVLNGLTTTDSPQRIADTLSVYLGDFVARIEAINRIDTDWSNLVIPLSNLV